MRWLPMTLSVLLLAGCVIEAGEPGGNTEQPGNITFLWSFPNGQTCSDVSGTVSFVHISLTGPNGPEVLDPGAQGWFNCTVAKQDGITLGQNADPTSSPFTAGSYTYTIDAYNLAKSTKYYTTTGTFHVNGDVVVKATLNPVFTPGHMQVFWKFMLNGAEKACSEAGIADGTGVSKIRVYINNEAPQDLDCTEKDSRGNAVQGWSWEKSPGSYQVTVDGLIVRPYTDPTTGNVGTEEQLWYSDTETITLASGQTLDQTFRLLPVAAGAHFVPRLHDPDDNIYPTCAAAGVAAFWIQLTDYSTPANKTVGFFSADCDAVLQHGFFWDYLPAFGTFDKGTGTWSGQWTVTMESWDKAETIHTVVDLGGKTALVTAGLADQPVPIDFPKRPK